MTLATYQRIKMGITVIIAMTVSISMVRQSFVIPVGIILVGSLLLLSLRRRVKEILADERDYAVAGKAASLSIQIYSWIATIGMLALYTNRGLNPSFEPVAMTLAYSTCVLMLGYSLIFKYHDKLVFSNNKSWYQWVGLLILAIIIVLGIRLFSGEDGWICQDGQWIEHGKPNFPAPETACK